MEEVQGVKACCHLCDAVPKPGGTYFNPPGTRMTCTPRGWKFCSGMQAFFCSNHHPVESCGSSLCGLCHESSDEGEDEPVLKHGAEEPPCFKQSPYLEFFHAKTMDPEHVEHIKASFSKNECFVCGASVPEENPRTVANSSILDSDGEPLEAKMCITCWAQPSSAERELDYIFSDEGRACHAADLEHRIRALIAQQVADHELRIRADFEARLHEHP